MRVSPKTHQFNTKSLVCDENCICYCSVTGLSGTWDVTFYSLACSLFATNIKEYGTLCRETEINGTFCLVFDTRQKLV